MLEAKLVTTTIRFRTKNEALVGVGILQKTNSLTGSGHIMDISHDPHSAWYTDESGERIDVSRRPAVRRLTWRVRVNGNISETDADAIQREAEWITQMLEVTS